MKIKEIVEMAIAGGYKFYNQNDWLKGEYVEGTEFSDFLLEPLFWQALSKGFGWNKHGLTMNMDDFQQEWYSLSSPAGAETEVFIVGRDVWRYYQYKFIDHLASGKDAESFFNKN